MHSVALLVIEAGLVLGVYAGICTHNRFPVIGVGAEGAAKRGWLATAAGLTVIIGIILAATALSISLDT